MKVKAYPNPVEIANGSEACISITPDKKWGREYHMGTVMLTDVRLRSYAYGDWDKANEYIEQYEPTPAMMSRLVEINYVVDEGTFYTVEQEDASPVDLTDRHFNVVYMCGERVFVSKEGL